MTYTPQPVDTSGIPLSESLEQLTERLAEHAHDVWARRRIEQGWAYGPERSDESKQHPCLVPYGELEEAEKQYDRNTAMETLKLLSALGYLLVRPTVAEGETPETNTGENDSLLSRIRAASSRMDAGSNNAKSELGALLDIWSKRRDDEIFWRSSPEPYRHLATRFLKLGAAPLAKEVARTALEYDVRVHGRRPHRPWAKDVELNLAFGLSLARTANTAHAQRVLGELRDRLHMDQDRPLGDQEKHVWQETLGMLGRTYKDQADQVSELDSKRRLRQQSLDMYETAYRFSGGYWTGINVATLARLKGDDSRARQVAHEVRSQCLAALDRADANPHDRYWVLATLGEAALVLGDLREAAEFYREAHRTAHTDFGNLHATRRHARWLLEHGGHDAAQLDVWLPIPKVIVFAGRMVDEPERFTAAIAEAIKTAIKAWLRQHNARVGFSSAASGSEILFQEAMHELGGECRVILPFHEDQFVVDNVDIVPGADWRVRFDAVLKNAVQVVRASRAPLQSGSVAYAFANQVLHGLAARRASELETPLVGLAMWNGERDGDVNETLGTALRWHAHGIPVFRVALAPPQSVNAPPVIDVEPIVASASNAGEIALPLHHGDCRVTALLFADAVGFSNLPDAEAPLFVQEFMGRIAALLDEYEVLPPSTPNGVWGSSAERQSNLRDSTWTAALGAHVPVRETWGDGLFLAFGSLHDAGEFALRLTEMVRDTNWAALGFSEKLSLRVALHAGPVYPGTDPITRLPKAIGSHISAAARLEPRTPPGEIYASEAFAALHALTRDASFACDYVEQLEWGKHYGTFPTYVVRRRLAQ